MSGATFNDPAGRAWRLRERSGISIKHPLGARDNNRVASG